MITVLVDHDMEGQAELLWSAIASAGWLDLVDVRWVSLAAMGVSPGSPDREVWRFAQAHGMFLLTNNRNMDDEDSLERTIREESTPASLPVVTVSTLDRFHEREYRAQCAERLIEIVLYPERYLGAGRVFIP